MYINPGYVIVFPYMTTTDFITIVVDLNLCPNKFIHGFRAYFLLPGLIDRVHLTLTWQPNFS
jgi:hypothetical protein